MDSTRSKIVFHHDSHKKDAKRACRGSLRKSGVIGTKAMQSGKINGTCGLSQGPRITVVLEYTGLKTFPGSIILVGRIRMKIFLTLNPSKIVPKSAI